ncbi:MAG TPA: ABC transporter permease [Pseudomonas sp.]|jgi:peptide/nickel transport system permease protein|uniref:ABC transporter permease subunit n=5 Tax=Pseudomonas TaxID=286 RepID=A0A0J6IA34_9PSED|nr:MULTISPECIES: ABC transporter permease [Pseudomonas]KMN08629.1 ABC transporter permease [Pseudomonas helleri]KMN21834.1 ABC transporter permease [Pseudomonas helleri]MQT33852.1 ABC transporter permease subunit [Pseudomonas helleri]MQT48462.1 ABC transporter permease subunit [Pseudomonas helleri]MQT55572.1 ABC transporter permease subunit [Pseudomonas sp. FSL R10-2398]
MNPLRLILRRLLSGIGVLWGAATLTFLAINLSAGDPAMAILGGPGANPSAELIAQVRAEYGLDQPLIVQYGQYLGRLAQGDLGDSYNLRRPVGQVISGQLGATVQLSLSAAALAVLLAVVVAVLSANRAPWVRSLVSGTELVLSSAPSFVIGLGLLLVFAFGWHLLPPSGSNSWQALILPSVALALPVAAVLSQVLRQELEDTLEQPFIAMARARGLSETGVRLKHALRHALVPLVTLSGFVFASLLGGAVVIELLFSRQGIGRLMLDAANTKDVPLLLGITLLAAAIYVVVNFLVDLINHLVDPRAKAV